MHRERERLDEGSMVMGDEWSIRTPIMLSTHCTGHRGCWHRCLLAWSFQPVGDGLHPISKCKSKGQDVLKRGFEGDTKELIGIEE